MLINGEAFPITDNDQLHLGYGVQTKLDDRLIENFNEWPTNTREYDSSYKNIGVDSLKGAGIIDLAKSTLEGVLSAEKV